MSSSSSNFDHPDNNNFEETKPYNFEETKPYNFEETKPFPVLPPEIWRHTFSFLPPLNRQHRQTSKKFCEWQDKADKELRENTELLLAELMRFDDLTELCIFIRHFQTTHEYIALEKKFRENTLTEKEWLCFLITNNIDEFALEDKRRLYKVTLEGFKNPDPYLEQMYRNAHTALENCDHDNHLGPDGAQYDEDKLNWLHKNPSTDQPLLYYLKAKYLRFRGDETFCTYDFGGKSFPCINLSGNNLSYKDLRNTNFSFGIFKRTEFSFIEEKTEGLNFSYADLTEARFIRTKLQTISFYRAILTDANFLSNFLTRDYIFPLLNSLQIVLREHPQKNALLKAVAENIVRHFQNNNAIQVTLLDEILNHAIFRSAAKNGSQLFGAQREAWHVLNNYKASLSSTNLAGKNSADIQKRI